VKLVNVEAIVSIFRNRVVSIAVIMVAAALIRLFDIGEKSLWLDEAYSVWFAKQSLEYIWVVGPTFELHPPLYYSLLHIWLLFGDSETALRLLSALAGIATIPLIYGLGRTIGGAKQGHWIGLLASALFAISALHIMYAQEARPYALLTASVTVVLLATAWIIRNPDQAAVPVFSSFRSRAFWAWAALVFGSVATLWLHNVGILYVASILSILPVYSIISYKKRRYLLYNTLISSVLITLCWLPWLPHILSHTQLMTSGFWIPAPNHGIVTATIIELFGFTQLPISNTSAKAVVLWILFAICGFGIFSTFRENGKQLGLLFTAALIGPIVLEIIFSLIVTPIFLNRTLIPILVPYYVFLSVGLIAIKPHRLKYLAAILVMMILVSDTYYYFKTYYKEPWRDIAEDIIERSISNDVASNIVLVLPNYAEFPIQYYFHRRKYNVDVVPLPSEFPDLDTGRVYAEIPGAFRVLESDLPRVEESIRDRREVWLVMRHGFRFDSNGIVRRWLGAKLNEVYARKVPDLDIHHFVKKSH